MRFLPGVRGGEVPSIDDAEATAEGSVGVTERERRGSKSNHHASHHLTEMPS